MLVLENISFSKSNKQIVRNASFNVSRNEIVCLLGPSGCGKTSLLRLIAGLEDPDGGLIKIDSVTVSSSERTLSPHRREIGFLFQDFALFPHLTVAENISFGLGGKTKREKKTCVGSLLEQIQMSDQAGKYPHQLSGGEQQRVALARARAPEPKLLLLDEPFSGLDSGLRKKLREETREVLRAAGASAIIVTHDPEEAMALADRIILMKDGKIIQNGTPSEIYHHPANSFVAQFLHDINSIKGQVVGGRIKTRLGEFEGSKFADGSEVEVLVRPESIKIHPSSKSQYPVHICDVRDTGNSCLYRLGIGNPQKPHSHINVRHRGSRSFVTGEAISVEIDQKEVLVFEK